MQERPNQAGPVPTHSTQGEDRALYEPLDEIRANFESSFQGLEVPEIIPGTPVNGHRESGTINNRSIKLKNVPNGADVQGQ